MAQKDVCLIFLLFCQLSAFIVEGKHEEKNALFFSSDSAKSNNLKLSRLFDDVKDKEDVKKGKFISLFSVVQFQNTACTSLITNSPNGNRIGSCFTANECSVKGGTASGNCASGFGVCCVFIVTGTSTVNQNCTYIRNVGFPTGSTSTTAITYTINKCGERSTEIAGGACSQDAVKFTYTGIGSGTTAGALPTICGFNTGQHIYLNLGANIGDTATVSFTFLSTSTFARLWDIKVTQVLCGTSTPPNGCFQYFTGVTGTIKTFNFDATTSTNLANQNYTSCIRQCKGFCCIQYLPCASATNAFTINQQGLLPNEAATDSQCFLDYIMISGAQNGCSNCNLAQTNRICGVHFGAFSLGLTGAINVPTPVCDCSQPFRVMIHTDALSDPLSSTTLSRGVCLTYTQIPCSSNG